MLKYVIFGIIVLLIGIFLPNYWYQQVYQMCQMQFSKQNQRQLRFYLMTKVFNQKILNLFFSLSPYSLNQAPRLKKWHHQMTLITSKQHQFMISP